MPYSNSDAHKAYMREYAKSRRLEWLAEHPCDCGAPSVSILSHDGRVPQVFTSSRQRMKESLDNRHLSYLCDQCIIKVKEWGAALAKERRRVRERVRTQERTLTRKPREPRAPREPRPAKEPSRISVYAPFQGTSYTCEKCGDTFIRHPLWSRHMRTEHGGFTSSRKVG